jgi:hypothetical protein
MEDFMRKFVKFMLIAMLLTALAACNTATPVKPVDPTEPTTPTTPTTPVTPTNPVDPVHPTDPVDPVDPAPVFEPNKLKGVVAGYKGTKQLKVRAYWNDENNEAVDISGEGLNTLETDGSFGIRLNDIPAEQLVTVPLFNCGTLEQTGTAQIAVVPNLFVYDGDTLVGVIVHGSYEMTPSGAVALNAKLATRIYSAEKEIIQGDCTAKDILENNGLPVDLTVQDVLTQIADADMTTVDVILGVNVEMAIADALSTFDIKVSEVLAQLRAWTGLPANFTLADVLNSVGLIPAKKLADVAALNVNVGLKPGWNAVVLSGDVSGGKLNLKLADDTKPNFIWYFVPADQFEQFIDR